MLVHHPGTTKQTLHIALATFEESTVNLFSTAFEQFAIVLNNFLVFQQKNDLFNNV